MKIRDFSICILVACGFTGIASGSGVQQTASIPTDVRYAQNDGKESAETPEKTKISLTEALRIIEQEYEVQLNYLGETVEGVLADLPQERFFENDFQQGLNAFLAPLGLVGESSGSDSFVIYRPAKPDCVFGAGSEDFGYIHRRLGNEDYYFIRSESREPAAVEVTFNVSGKLPEFWDPVSGEVRPAQAWVQRNGQTVVPVEFTPFGSWFIVFRKEVPTGASGTGKTNSRSVRPLDTLDGDWQVSFDPEWGAPASTIFSELETWTTRPEEGIRFYSGSAVYHKKFNYKGDRGRELWLDLGEIGDVGIARVTLNGKNLDTLWAPPFRVNISEMLRKKNNLLEIEVINSWRNRLVGDRDLPEDKRFTRTNITIRDDWELLESGLLGPVTISATEGL